MAINVWRAARADHLLAVLASQLANSPPADVMTPELICVPTRGVERWVAQQVASITGPQGIFANVEFQRPWEFLSAAIEQAVGGTPLTGIRGWDEADLFWVVTQLVDEAKNETWLGVVGRQITANADSGSRNRLPSTRYISALYSRYHWFRPEMVLSWLDGHDVDAAGAPLASADRWQPQLWRAVRQRIGTPSPPELLTGALAGSAAIECLPERISVFGLTHLPAGQLEFLAKLGAAREVDLYLLHPSAHWWGAAEVELLKAPEIALDRSSSELRSVAQNQLLKSLGRDSGELARSLFAVDSDAFASSRCVDAPQREPRTTLGRLQKSIRDNAVLAPSAPTGAPDDGSLRIHSCHGSRRQVHVVRDEIMHLLASDPTLEPRDIVVMCPDIEEFAPHIHAVFDQLPELRPRLADRAAVSENHAIRTLGHLLSLASSRCSAAEVLGLLSEPLVAARFNLSDDDLERIHDWVSETGIRWGLSVKHRMGWGDLAAAANTWDSGLDRIALGAANPDEGFILTTNVRPCDDVAGSDLGLAATISEYFDILQSCIAQLSDTAPVSHSLAVLHDAIDALMQPSRDDEWMTLAAHDTLQRIAESIERTEARSVSATARELLTLLEDEFVGKPTTQNFRSGDLTFCTMTPMRSIPHRVVVLLGLDDRRYPRKGRSRGDDLLARSPRVGDSDVRSQDRQLLLDAIMAATETLVVTYSGRSERTNEELRPSVPIDELLTALTGGDTVEQLVVNHPLQEFDPRNFLPGALGRETSWSFSAQKLAAGSRYLRPAGLQRPLLDEPLPTETLATVELADLARFAAHPVRTFFNQRLNVSFDEAYESIPATYPVSIDGLLAWSLGSELLDALAAVDFDRIDEIITNWRHATLAGGVVPPGSLAADELRRIETLVRAVDVRRRSVDPTPPNSRLVEWSGGQDGLTMRGVVAATPTNEVLHATTSRIAINVSNRTIPNGKHLVGPALKAAALAAQTGSQVVTNIIGRGPWIKNGPETLCHFTVSSPPDPDAYLDQAIALFRQGMTSPLPVFSETSCAFVSVSEDLRVAAVKQVWESPFNRKAEDQDRYIVTAFGHLSASELLADPDFSVLAQQLYGPLVAAARIEQVRL